MPIASQRDLELGVSKGNLDVIPTPFGGRNEKRIEGVRFDEPLQRGEFERVAVRDGGYRLDHRAARSVIPAPHPLYGRELARGGRRGFRFGRMTIVHFVDNTPTKKSASNRDTVLTYPEDTIRTGKEPIII